MTSTFFKILNRDRKYVDIAWRMKKNLLLLFAFR